MIPWAGDILTKPCWDRFFSSSLALNLTRGQATKYDRNKLHKVTFVAQNYIFVLFFQTVFRSGRWDGVWVIASVTCHDEFFATSCAGRLQNRSQWHRRNRQRRRYLLFLFKVFKKTYDICIDQMTKLWNSTFDKCKKTKTVCYYNMFANAMHPLHLLPWKYLADIILLRKKCGLGGSVDVLSFCIRKDNGAFFSCCWTSMNICYQMSRNL